MLTEPETDTLRQAAGLIIPASEAYDVPGADDLLIMAEIAVSAAREAGAVRAALTAFAAQPDESFPKTYPAHAEVLQTIVASCYYRDARVLRSLGRSAEPPFPNGFQVEEGDFSLLDPVRARGPIWRKI